MTNSESQKVTRQGVKVNNITPPKNVKPKFSPRKRVGGGDNVLPFTRSPYMVDKDGDTVVYLGGSAKHAATIDASAGFGLWWGAYTRRFIIPNSSHYAVGGRQTITVALIQGAVEAVLRAKGQGFKAVHIYTSSELIVKAINEWLKYWIVNDWHKTDSKDVVENREDWEKLVSAQEGIVLKATHASNRNRTKENGGLMAVKRLAKRAVAKASRDK